MLRLQGKINFIFERMRLKFKYKFTFSIAICTALYGTFAYGLIRTEYFKLLGLYSILFLLFLVLMNSKINSERLLTLASFLFRGIFILAIPNLSQDFYRFIWDGRIILEGFNPYLHTVTSFIEQGEFPVAQAQELRNGMGDLNAGHFTNYPPINQLCFVIAGLFSGKSIIGAVVVLRLLIIAADFGTLYFGKKLLKALNLSSKTIFWYILNPFIIIELTGNLHFEGVMVFFLIWSLYLLHQQKWFWSAVVLALSISVKLVPLLFLPIFFKWFVKGEPSIKKKYFGLEGFTKLIGFYIIVLGSTALFFLPFYSNKFISNYTETVALWFQNFEFNASLYYVAREIGYLFRGYNEIATIGKTIPVLVFLFVLCIAFFRSNRHFITIISSMVLALSFYYFCSTTVHPWYIATLLILSVFTKYKFPFVWSFIIILSYLAYVNLNKADKSENLWVITMEYIIVYAVFIWEVFIGKWYSLKKLKAKTQN